MGIVNADGSGFHLITSGNSNNAFASFGPDGKQIVYRTTGPTPMDQKMKVLTNEWTTFLSGLREET